MESWGTQKKYCLKANYVDFSHCRNIVAAKLWGQAVRSRPTRNDKLYGLPNGGAIDGFPIMVAINGEYQGIYTFNKKVCIFLLVGVANVIDTQVLQNGAAIRTAVIFFYLSNEGLSILENSAVIGIPIPEKLKDMLIQLTNEKHISEKNDEKEE